MSVSLCKALLEIKKPETQRTFWGFRHLIYKKLVSWGMEGGYMIMIKENLPSSYWNLNSSRKSFV